MRYLAHLAHLVHPLQADGRLVDGIERERGILREVRANADLVIDTSKLNVHELRQKIVSFFGGGQRPGLMISWSPSAISKACRPASAWWWTAASCPTRTGFRNFAK